MVEFNHDKIPLYKLIVHCAQIVLSVTIWILEIIVFKGGDINGQNGWTFGVVRSTQFPVAQVLHRCVSYADASPSFAVLLFSPSMDLPHNGPSLPTSRQHCPA